MSMEPIAGRVPHARFRFSLKNLFAGTFVVALGLAGVGFLQVPGVVGWISVALGGPYTVMVPLVGVVCFVLAGVTVKRGTGAMAVAALLLLCQIPLLMGTLVFLHKGLNSLHFMSVSTAAPKASEIHAGIANAMSTLMVALIIAAPTLAIATIGAFVRSQRHKRRKT